MKKVKKILERNILIEELTHKYYLDGIEVNKPSVSKLIDLLPHHVFDTSFAETPEGQQILDLAITRGIHLHKIAENFINEKITKNCCEIKSHFEMKEWLLWVLNKISNDYPESEGWEIISELSMIGKEYVGTLDLLLINTKLKKYVIGDIKTTKLLAKNKEALQVVLYNDLLKERFKQVKFSDFELQSFFVINCNLINKQIYLIDEETLLKANTEKEEILAILKSLKI
ncbi:hypothetical protein mflW37_7010 [Mesoplasma florum W37]|uniref:PD-(D/E)XK endonuclease-like domain-containing protein n=1 Tax=Mesoplasma florum TaxID=2151 RepID=A0AAD0HSG7_MESFO|nr:hypothetical protein [Mesoplasma florum]AGY41768.1 hypothetical protein mflW37_7010 [Mesoplasma florum W37]AVN59968.1 hypothetical protein CG008_03680 [Mesoplasma florum]AVN66107.1 hypothetical protein MflW12_7020 [Mesoplasma florum]